MQDSVKLRNQALRCLTLAESAYDERLAAQLLGLSEQLLQEAGVAAMKEEIGRRRMAIHRNGERCAGGWDFAAIKQEIKQRRVAIARENETSAAEQDSAAEKTKPLPPNRIRQQQRPRASDQESADQPTRLRAIRISHRPGKPILGA